MYREQLNSDSRKAISTSLSKAKFVVLYKNSKKILREHYRQPIGNPTLGDPPGDQEWIKRGGEYFKANYHE